VLSDMADTIATDTRGMARIASGSDLRQWPGGTTTSLRTAW
jgi:hypothetical protein